MSLKKYVPAIGALCIGAGYINAGCIGSTGGQLVSFPATAHGIFREGVVNHPDGDHSGDPLRFTTNAGWDVTLTRATTSIGALYLSATRPLQNVRESACYAPSLYVGEVRGSRVVDLLDPTPQPFPVLGEGIADRALSAEIWLGSNLPIDAEDDKTVVLAVDGTAVKSGVTIPFRGRFTIGSNRKKPPQSLAQPGSNPLCQQRILTPILIDFSLANVPAAASGSRGLDLTADPRTFFATVAFEQLPEPLAPGEPRLFIDKEEGQPSTALYQSFRANSGPWTFRFTE